MAAKKITITVADAANLSADFAFAKAAFDAAEAELNRIKDLIKAIPEVASLFDAEGNDTNVALVGDLHTVVIAKGIRETLNSEKVKSFLTPSQIFECAQTSVFPRMTTKTTPKFDGGKQAAA